MRIGVICSAGGASFMEAARLCPHVEFIVVTDRLCGVEAKCVDAGIRYKRIEEPSRENFSQCSYEFLDRELQCDFIIMLFSRLVAEPLVGSTRLLNIHPSLLPSFPGIGAVEKARLAGVRYFGATLHAVDQGIDSGAILAQVCQAVPPELAKEDFEHLSFLHKTSLFLLAIELHESGRLVWEKFSPKLMPGVGVGDGINPPLTNSVYIEGVRRLQSRGPKFL